MLVTTVLKVTLQLMIQSCLVMSVSTVLTQLQTLMVSQIMHLSSAKQVHTRLQQDRKAATIVKQVSTALT